MSLGFRLLARLSRPSVVQEELIVQVQKWLHARYPEMRPKTRRGEVDSSPVLYCRMHPAAEEFELLFVSRTQLVASANSTTVGPGYHIFLTSLLKDLAREFHASWERPADDSGEFGDETGYFFAGDERSLKGEMAIWLAALGRLFFDGSLDSDTSGVALCMPMNPQFTVQEPAATPLGPRDRAWLFQMSQNGLSGKDFFAWWDSGFNAKYYLQRALAQMWMDLRWRPAINDSEASALEDVADCLHRAYELDADLPFPWPEWKQVLELLGREGEQTELVTSRARGEPVIGYRRKDVKVELLGGWSIRVPGAFSDFEPNDQNDLCAIDPPREIWLTVFGQSKGSSASAFKAMRKEVKRERPDYLIDCDDYLARATLSRKQRESGEEYFVLNSVNLGVGTRLVCTIVFNESDHSAWAVETWRSIQPPSNNRH